MQKVRKNFHQKKILAVAVLFFVIFFLKAKNNVFFESIAICSLFFSDWYYGKVRACGTLISPFNSFKLRRKKSGNSEVAFIMPSQRHILALLCDLKSEKKCNLQMKSRKPNLFASPYRGNKNQQFLEFFLKWNCHK